MGRRPSQSGAVVEVDRETTVRRIVVRVAVLFAAVVGGVLIWLGWWFNHE
jgi:hypothetical protein